MDATAIYVAYRTRTIDCGWIPDSAPVIVVHNDRTFDRGTVDHPRTLHLDSPSNVGFGAAVNRAVSAATTERVVLCNPDTVLTPEHWSALDGDADEVVTIPLVDGSDVLTSVVAPYWTPLALAGASLRLGARLAPLGSRRRRLLSDHGGAWLRHQSQSLSPVATSTGDDVTAVSGRSWPLRDRWVSGAVMSIDRRRMSSVDGFDTRYFLYFEDTDLCRRLACRYPAMTARVAATPPGRHTVGATGAGPGSSTVERLRRRAAVIYGAGQVGWQWWPYRLLDALLSDPSPAQAATSSSSP
jgi:hypothetical protein